MTLAELKRNLIIALELNMKTAGVEEYGQATDLINRVKTDQVTYEEIVDALESLTTTEPTLGSIVRFSVFPHVKNARGVVVDGGVEVLDQEIRAELIADGLSTFASWGSIFSFEEEK